MLAAVVFAALGVHGYLARTSLPKTLLTAPAGTPLPSAGEPTSSSSDLATPVPSLSRGPKLSSTDYARFAFEIYPAPPSPATRRALAGFQVSVAPHGTSIELRLRTLSDGSTITHDYAASDRIYFVEASLGDDTTTQEFNLGDDGLVVTDADGYLVG